MRTCLIYSEIRSNWVTMSAVQGDSPGEFMGYALLLSQQSMMHSTAKHASSTLLASWIKECKKSLNCLIVSMMGF